MAKVIPLARRKPEGEKRSLFGSFDSETVGLDGEFILLTAQYETSIGNVSVTEVFNRPEDFLDWVLSDPIRRRVIWFAHNAEYDWRYFLAAIPNYLDRYDVIPRVRGLDKIYELAFKVKGTRKEYHLTMRDSLALFPFSLEDFAKKFSSKKKMDIGLKAGVLFDRNNPDHMAYAIRDTEALLECMINFDRLVYEAYGVHVKGTVASTAYNAWLRHIPEDMVYWQSGREVEDFVRKAYYGGIVYIRHINVHYPQVKTFDINSSYPNVMERFGIPCGKATFVDNYQGPEVPAFYEVDVDASDVPDDAFHFIAKREKANICWARGKFRTNITSAEFATGLKYGYKFDVVNGCTFDALEFPFNDFVSICKRLRKENKGEALEQVAKLMQNSLYGKFGMGRVGSEFAVTDEIPEGEGWSAHCDRDTGALNEHVWTRETERDAAYIMPHWAAWITAQARLQLVIAQQAAGDDMFLYADTDSVTVFPQAEQRMIAAGLLGNEYGQLKDEGYKYDWVCRGPKAYTYLYDNAKTGKRELGIKMKGIPKRALTETVAMQIHRGEMPDVPFHISKGLAAAMKTHTFGMDAHRKPTNCANLMAWEVDDTRTHALPRRYG